MNTICRHKIRACRGVAGFCIWSTCKHLHVCRFAPLGATYLQACKWVGEAGSLIALLSRHPRWIFRAPHRHMLLKMAARLIAGVTP